MKFALASLVLIPFVLAAPGRTSFEEGDGALVKRGLASVPPKYAGFWTHNPWRVVDGSTLNPPHPDDIAGMACNRLNSELEYTDMFSACHCDEMIGVCDTALAKYYGKVEPIYFQMKCPQCKNTVVTTKQDYQFATCKF